jgi:PKD repeat protein
MSRTSSLPAILTLAALALSFAGCAPKADFTASVTAGDAPLIVKFTDNSETLFLDFINIASIIPITGREWDFGDLTGSLETSPSHTYTSPGLYSVSLTVSTWFTEVTTTKAQLIRVDYDPPAASFSSTAATTDVRSYTFTDTSTAGGASIGSRQWDFGDGASSTATNPTHSFAAAGPYTVSLTVCSSAGCNTATRTITVPAFTAPAAQLRITSNTSAARTYDFADTSTAGNIPITSRQWSFGDGGVATTANATHPYAADGVYEVSLEVCAGTLCNTATSSLTVGTRPSANFTITRVGDTSSLTFDFRDGSAAGSSPLNTRQWTFSDGELATTDVVRHTFAAPGDYTVSLEVCGGSLCATATRVLRITPGNAEILETP